MASDPQFTVHKHLFLDCYIGRDKKKKDYINQFKNNLNLSNHKSRWVFSYWIVWIPVETIVTLM